jgi:hypothetical protein
MWGWWKKAEPQPDPLMLELVDALKQQQVASQKLMERMLEQADRQAAQTAEMMQSIMELWKPTRAPLASSMEERAIAKELEEKAWEPIPFNVFAQLDKDLGIPLEFLQDD